MSETQSNPTVNAEVIQAAAAIIQDTEYVKGGKNAERNPKRPCQYCNKMISIANMSNHCKKSCKGKKEAEAKLEPLQLQETITHLRGQVELLTNQLNDATIELKSTKRELSKCDQNYKMLLGSVMVFKGPTKPVIVSE